MKILLRFGTSTLESAIFGVEIAALTFNAVTAGMNQIDGKAMAITDIGGSVLLGAIDGIAQAFPEAPVESGAALAQSALIAGLRAVHRAN